MPFQITRDDLTRMRVDAIVNSANPLPRIGAGVDAGIHALAGTSLLEARKQIGNIQPGEAAITPGFQLNAKYVIHTVGPVWVDGNSREPEVLAKCYASALELAVRSGCRSVAFPLISTGNYGFPKSLALQIAISQISAFLMHHELDIYLVVFHREAFQLSEKLFSGIQSFIDDHYVKEKVAQEYCYPVGSALSCDREEQVRRRRAAERLFMEKKAPAKSCRAPAAAAKPSLRDLLQNTDAGFAETLFALIDQRGYKDSEVYKRANLSKQHFSKIRKNPAYKPTKPTAVALAIALQLDLEQTRDLIGRAGYALTNSSKFDVIIMYFIEQKNYDLFEINSALFEFDQSLLGGCA